MAIRLTHIVNEVRAHILACDKCASDGPVSEALYTALDEMDSLNREPIIRSGFEYAKRRMLNLHSIRHDGITYVPQMLNAVTAQLQERANWREIRETETGHKWVSIRPRQI